MILVLMFSLFLITLPGCSSSPFLLHIQIKKEMKMNKLKKTRKAFTIVELVIVVAVIAILAAVLISTFSNIITEAKISKMYSEANTIYKNYLVEEVKNENIPDYIIIEVEQDMCILYFKGEQIQNIFSLNEVNEKVSENDEFELIKLENNDKIYISQKIKKENNKTRVVEFIIKDEKLMLRYEGEEEWKFFMDLDDLTC